MRNRQIVNTLENFQAEVRAYRAEVATFRAEVAARQAELATMVVRTDNSLAYLEGEITKLTTRPLPAPVNGHLMVEEVR